ncbi:serine hydrolase domain-containing protein [Fictibacillus sp. BK138]|uniref:serine hydrolase domain-containing protein n=1 Tax=Fictibacillus sp. BK138 TaxID=2512121 RepID=UPI001028E9B9|nr:serine hydrolase domain-containing protein [Fictibacillus sp. BK138]RZT15483.1 CubicO group peptidase (beta-lactamase class C family) [Fictibacillus sp. BK138]
MNYKQIEELIAEKMQIATVPGLAIVLFNKHDVLFEKGFGYTSTEETALNVTPHTLFSIGSISKVITGTLIMKLVEKGILDLDRPIRAYVPWFTLHNEQETEKVTLRRLLSHTVGLPHVFEAFGSQDSDGLNKLVMSVPNHPLLFPPGESWSYSDLGVDTAGYVAEAVTGISFNELVQEFVFDPISLERSTYDLSKAVTYPLALPHSKKEDGSLGVAHRFPANSAHNPSSFAMASMSELAKIGQMFLKSGGDFLNENSVREMMTLHGDYFMPNQSGYGLTLELDFYKGIRRAWHDGALQSLGAWMFIAPDEDFGVVMACNKREGFWGHAEEIIEMIFNLRFPNETEKVYPQNYKGKTIPLNRCTGTYVGAWTGYVSISQPAGGLVLNMNDHESVLTPYGKDRFQGTSSEGEVLSVGFQNKEDSEIKFIMVNGIPCEKIAEVPEYTHPVDTYSSYIGSFIKNNDRLEFRVEDDKLYCYDQYDDTTLPCKVTGDNTVVAGSILVEFLQDSIRINKGSILTRV